MIFNLSTSQIGGGGTSEWQDVTDDIDIDYFYCDPLEDFKAYLYNNVLVMFGSLYIENVFDAKIILPQDFNCVIGGALPLQDMLSPMTSGYPMESTEYGCEKYISGGKLCEIVNGFNRNCFALEVAALDFEIVVCISKFSKNSCCCGVVFLGDRDSGGSFENLREAFKIGSCDCTL